MASIHDRFQVPTDPAVITPFEDVDDPLADADVPVASIERDDSSYYIFGPPSQSSDGRYTTRTRSSIGGGGGRGRRFSNHTQLTEPSSISDMPSDCFPLEKQKRSIAKAAMAPHQTTTMAAMARTSSPAISPTTTHRDITAYRTGVAAAASPSTKPRSSHHQRPRPRRSHHHTGTTTAIDTPTRFHPEPTPTYSPYHSRTPSSSSHSSSHRAPLILLHVTLLPSPALPYPPHLLRRVLPRSTMRAYAQLEERLADPVLMTRGLLVAHPREEMDVLEERVLEGLELRAPRVLKCGHFYHVEDGGDDEGEGGKQKHRRDSGVEAEAEVEADAEAEVEADAEAEVAAAVDTEPAASAAAEDDDAEEEEEYEETTCTECHAHLPLPFPPSSSSSPSSARWTIKIYAANGLLAGPGAWSAAWSEMERVDVAITPYLSPAQHRALQAAVREEEAEQADLAARAAEIAARDAEERDASLRAAQEAGRREAEAEAEARAEEVRMEAEQRLEGERVEAEERLEAERMDAEQRLEAERMEAEEKRKEAEERLEAERMEAEERLEEEKQERLRLIGSAALAAAAERKAAEERVEEAKVLAVREERKRVREERARRVAEAERARREVPLATLVRRALWVAAVDWRNVLIAVLGAWLWMGAGIMGSGDVSRSMDLEVSGVFFDAAVSPFFENGTIEQIEVVRTTETVTATATATQTSTAIVTAFILETLAPQALEQSASTTTAVDLSEPTDTPDAAVDEEYKDAVFAATTEILASAFEKMEAIIATLVEAYEKTADDQDASAREAQLPRTDVCSTFPELAYPTCAIDEEVFDVQQVEEDPRPRTCANRELEVEYFNRAAPTCSVNLVWV